MKNILFAMLFLPITLFGQDVIPTNSGDIKITPILHGTLVIEYQGKTIYVDPYGGASAFDGQNTPDIVLITDIHGDHHNPETLDGLDLSKATIVAPKAVADQLDESKSKSILVMNNDQGQKVSDIFISTIPMYNLPETDDSRHPKGRGNGYILSMGGKNIYLSGDTEDIPEMRALKEIDVAFVCMNLPYTMDVDQAADAVSEFKPSIVYPYHYRGTDGLADVEKFKSLVNANAPEVEVRLKNWYPSN